MSYSLSRRRLLQTLAAAGVIARPAQGLAAAPQPGWHLLDTEAYKGKQDDIFFVDPQTGWYGNGKGKLFFTDTGGDNWRLIWEKPGTYIRALGFADKKLGFLGNIGLDDFPGVTDPQPLYVTRDGGTTWSAATAISGSAPRGICAIDVLKFPYINAGTLDHRLTVRAGGRVGGPAHLMTSKDAGRSWVSEDLSPLTFAVLDIHFVSETVGFIAGASAAEVEASNAVILRTIDGGKHWSRVYQSNRPYEIIWKISFPTSQTGYATIQNYNDELSVATRYVAKTVNGGATWRELPLVSDHSVQQFGVGFLDDRRGWVGASPHGFETRDGGASWTPADLGRATNKIRIIRGDHRIRAFSIGSDVRRLDL